MKEKNDFNKLETIKKNSKIIFGFLIVATLLISVLSLIFSTDKKPNINNLVIQKTPKVTPTMTPLEIKKQSLDELLPYKTTYFKIEPPSYETRGNYVVTTINDNDEIKNEIYNWFAENGVTDKSKLNILWINELTIK